MTALRWATPVWVVTVGAVGAAMFLTDFAMKIGTEEAVMRLALVAIVVLPLIAFVVKATSDDVVRFHAAFLAKDVEKSDR